MEAGREAPVSEAQIAVHWREEEYYYPPAAFIGQANAADPAILERFSEGAFPRVLQGVRGSAQLGRLLAHDA
jgi:acetyl-CoA synthetase